MTETGTEMTNLTAEQIRNLTAEREYLEAKAAQPSTDAWFRGYAIERIRTIDQVLREAR